jgi:hypothetical protein
VRVPIRTWLSRFFLFVRGHARALTARDRHGGEVLGDALRQENPLDSPVAVDGQFGGGGRGCERLA